MSLQFATKLIKIFQREILKIVQLKLSQMSLKKIFVPNGGMNNLKLYLSSVESNLCLKNVFVTPVRNRSKVKSKKSRICSSFLTVIISSKIFKNGRSKIFPCPNDPA